MSNAPVRHRPSTTAAMVLVLVILSGAFGQAAITNFDQLKAAAASGGEFTLAAGSIFLDEPIVVASELSITGVGISESILIVRGAKVGLIVQPGGNLTLRDLWVDGGPADTPGGSDLIHVGGRLVVRDSRISGARFEAASDKPYGLGSGVYIGASGSATVLGSAFERNALTAIEATEGATLELAGTLVRNNLNGVLTEGDARATLLNNYIVNNYAIGLVIRGRTVAIVMNNTIEANGRRQDERGVAYDGVRIGGSAQVNLANNRFFANPRFGVSVYGNAVITAEDNLHEGSGGFSELDNKHHSALLVSENAVYHGSNERFLANPSGAIELDGNARVELTAVVMRDTGSNTAVFLDDDSTLTLIDADLEGNEGSVVVWNSSNLNVQGGRFVGSGGHAFYLGGGVTSIVGAQISGSAGVAIRASLEAVATIHDNLVANNRSGIVFLDTSRGDVRNNRVENNESNGIAFAEGSSGAVIGNTVVHTPTEGEGLFVAPGLDVEVAGNFESVP